jgi:hypothetical protein
MGRVSVCGLVTVVAVQLVLAVLLARSRYAAVGSASAVGVEGSNSLPGAAGTGDFSQSERDLLLGISDGEPLIVTIASLSMVELVCNFLCSLRKHNVSRYVVFATDGHTQSALSKHGVESILNVNLFNEVRLPLAQ